MSTDYPPVAVPSAGAMNEELAFARLPVVLTLAQGDFEHWRPTGVRLGTSLGGNPGILIGGGPGDGLHCAGAP